MKNKLKPLAFAIAFTVACSACNKTVIKEEIQFPKQVELLVGQYCIPRVILEEDETIRVFTDWVSSDQDVAKEKGDTIFALAAGESTLVTSYSNRFGNQETTCAVTVSDWQMPTPNDTVFAQIGETQTLCKFDIPGRFTITYQLEYGSGSSYSAALVPNELPHETSSIIEFSPVYTYQLTTIVPEQGFTSLRLICEPLGMDVTMPIVTLPSNEGENRNTNL